MRAPALIGTTPFPAVARASVQTLQVNLGYRCNQACVHCHVEAGPKRTEEMDRKTVELVLDYLQESTVSALDLTGGAPELNPNFRYLVAAARQAGVRVIDRCNLTILEEPGFEDMADFLAANQVEIIASLPCYQKENVERQRGKGVFDTSVRVIRRLNQLGYGADGGGLELNLVYNPQGAQLPPPQQQLERTYKEELGSLFGLRFNRLFTLSNMPIKRFARSLRHAGEFEAYHELLREAHQTENLATVMCRNLLSVDWRGYVYDCDFNQMLALPLRHNGSANPHLSDLLGVDLSGQPVVVADHCFGCTAGQGSSCGGALA